VTRSHSHRAHDSRVAAGHLRTGFRRNLRWRPGLFYEPIEWLDPCNAYSEATCWGCPLERCERSSTGARHGPFESGGDSSPA